VLPAITVRPRRSARTSEPLRRVKKERTRVAIDDAALDLFAERGYEETTVEQIAARAEVSKATFFRYFASKGEVIFGATDERHEPLRRAILDRPESEGPLTAVRVAMREAWLPSIDPLRTVRQTRAARTSPLLRGLSLDLANRWQVDVGSALARRRGRRAADRECRLVAGIAFAVLSNAVNLWIDSGAEGDLVLFVDEGFDLVVGLFPHRLSQQQGVRQ
jgi:TetR/AcrR family transcriptional regulator, regulator of mycofactocin system